MKTITIKIKCFSCENNNQLSLKYAGMVQIHYAFSLVIVVIFTSNFITIYYQFIINLHIFQRKLNIFSCHVTTKIHDPWSLQCTKQLPQACGAIYSKGQPTPPITGYQTVRFQWVVDGKTRHISPPLSPTLPLTKGCA